MEDEGIGFSKYYKINYKVFCCVVPNFFVILANLKINT